MWRRRDFRETSWAAAELLQKALVRQSRRLRARDWLLLLVRSVLIALLVAAMARPYWSLSAAASAGGRTYRLLVLDDSYSMSSRGDVASSFEQAKEIARRIVGQAASSDAFTLVLMSAPPRVILGPTTDATAVLRKLEELTASQGVADLPAAIELALKQLDAAGRQGGSFARHEVCFISDMQRTTWAPRMSDSERAAFQRSSKELAAAASVKVVEVGRAGEDNPAIVEFCAENPPAFAGREMILRAELRNFGEKLIRRRAVELWIDGRREDVQSVDIGPDKTAAVEFRLRFDSPGDRAIEVRADGDGSALGNRRYLALPVDRAVRVLCIDGRPAAERLRGAAGFVALALATDDGGSGQPAMQTVVAAEDDMMQRDWSEFDCLVFCDVAAFTAAEVRRIEDFLHGGGGAGFILGGVTRSERYNTELGPTGQGRAGRPAILPAAVGSLSEQSLRIDPLGCRHPMLEAFREKGRAGLSAAIVMKHFSLKMPEQSPPNVVLALENGGPLLVEREVGGGRVALMAAAAEPSWTSLPLAPVFPPLMREIVLYCTAGRGRMRQVKVGQTLRIHLPPQAAADNPRIELPSGSVRPLGPASVDNTAACEFADTDSAGFYVVKYGPSLENKMLFAVNVDAAEADPKWISPQELRERVWPDVAFEMCSERGGDDTHASAWPPQDCSPSVVLLYAVLGLLFVDLFISRSRRQLP
jgi:hypothetical protein